ncbi:MAG: hypothetical protein BGO92_02510 [Magnetospirillum sp. 64-120]|nr:MAG: hypothetical protein BGO92_02510 [Magnetospirillum sp. 64-120]
MLHAHAYGFHNEDGTLVGVVCDRLTAAVAAAVGFGWSVFARSDARSDCFVVLAPGLEPEDLPIAPGYLGWVPVSRSSLTITIH